MKDTIDEDDPIYQNFKKLNANIQPVEKGSDLYKLLESYALTTHDKKYFSAFDLEVCDVVDVGGLFVTLMFVFFFFQTFIDWFAIL